MKSTIINYKKFKFVNASEKNCLKYNTSYSDRDIDYFLVINKELGCYEDQFCTIEECKQMVDNY